MPPVTTAIVGAGKRGEAYAQYALDHPEELRIVAVAEPRQLLRERLAQTHNVPLDHCYDDFRTLAAAGRIADAVAICTQDKMHLEPVELLAPLGYAILLEKPISPDESECERVIECIRQHGNLFAVCHVLLYTSHAQKLRSLLHGGAVGAIISIQHLEPVGWWHQAHSFVRGNWRRSDESAFMLLQKSCHDIDWLSHIAGSACQRVASFGSLRHFRPEQKPAGAADRCWNCPQEIEENCPYSALGIYHRPFGKDPRTDYLNDVITGGVGTLEAVEEALKSGPYGRCVYNCDNDVVDNQTVMLEFEGPITANFTMTAFTPGIHRQTRIFGTRGSIETNFETIKVFDFLTKSETIHDTRAGDADASSGHGGGDTGLMRAFVAAVASGDRSLLYSGAEESLTSHRIVFAAERARIEKRIVSL
ncbi:MAG: Gfo/Idh/MocA family protein [Luteolibacter sp.]